MDNPVAVIALIFQGIITVLFLGSFWVGYGNLLVFKKSYLTNTLKTVMDDYQKLINENAFNCYSQDLMVWKSKMADSDFSPALCYHNTLKHLSRIGQFYEHVGLLVQDELIDYDILFELLPFPYKFWEDTTEFRTLMQEMTYVDFWSHFQYLHHRYLETRSQRERPKHKADVLKLTCESNEKN